MLLRFGVDNHRSIASYQELSMVATSLKDHDDGLITANPDTLGKKILVSPVAGIYGANAAGKSTLLEAFDFFCSGIVSSHAHTASSTGTPHVPFRFDDFSNGQASKYDVDIVINGIRYHYGYMLDGKKISNEWLYSFDLNSARRTRTILFARETNDENNTVFKFGKTLKGENKQIAKFVRPNSLFLSTAAQNSHPQLSQIFEFFYSKVVRRLDDDIQINNISEQLTAYFGDNEKRRLTALEFLRAADVGISGMDFSKVTMNEKSQSVLKDFEQVISKHYGPDDVPGILSVKEIPRVKLIHSGKDGKSYPIDLKRESSGTLSLLQLIGPVLVRLIEGGILMVDELNSKLHPLVSRELIKLFLDPRVNTGNAQLIFTTHDTNILSGNLLRRDQVWFAEKDGDGSTHIYSLSDIKVRSSDNIEKGYLTGRFGAIPFSGCSLNDFIGDAGRSREMD